MVNEKAKQTTQKTSDLSESTKRQLEALYELNELKIKILRDLIESIGG